MVDKPSAVQSVVWLGNIIDLPHGHPDIEPLRVANQILGGGMSGRLFTNLREDKAFTYGAYSNFGVSDELNATFGASAKVRNEVTDSAITEFLNEIGRMRTEAVSEDDLIAAKASLSGSFGRSLESPASAANFALNIARYDLSADYYNNYLARLDAVTAEDVLRVSNQYMDADHLTITVVGKAQDVAGKLVAFGAVEYFDANGASTDATNLPLYARRCHKGNRGKCFLQRHWWSRSVPEYQRIGTRDEPRCARYARCCRHVHEKNRT